MAAPYRGDPRTGCKFSRGVRRRVEGQEDSAVQDFILIKTRGVAAGNNFILHFNEKLKFKNL